MLNVKQCLLFIVSISISRHFQLALIGKTLSLENCFQEGMGWGGCWLKNSGWLIGCGQMEEQMEGISLFSSVLYCRFDELFF